MRRLIFSASQSSNANATDDAGIERVSLPSVVTTMEDLRAAPLSLNETFHRVAELRSPAFWSIASAARTLAGLPPLPSTGSPQPADATAQRQPQADVEPLTDSDFVRQLDNITAMFSQLPDQLGWPVLRRILLAAVIRRRLDSGPLSASVQVAVQRLALALYAHHRRAAGRKGTIDYFHVSKAGGTTFCQLAKLNGCSTQSFAARRNCLIREFDDIPRWVNNTLHNALAPEDLRTPWFANYGVRARNDVSCRMRKRQMLRRRFTVSANEFTLYGGRRAPRAVHLCSSSLNVVQLRHPQARLRSHLMWAWALYDHHFKEQAAAFFPSTTAAHWTVRAAAGRAGLLARVNAALYCARACDAACSCAPGWADMASPAKAPLPW